MKRAFSTWIFCCLFAFNFSELAAQRLIVKQFGVPDSLRSYPPNTSVLKVLKGGTLLSTASTSGDEMIKVILQLSSPARKGPKGLSGSSSIQQQSALLTGITSVAPSATVSRRFTEVLNAVAVTLPRKSLGSVSSLPGIARVYEDRSVKALGTPSSSGPLKVQTAEAADTSSDSVRVGVIDTGIDYLHEAFGGGFGAGYTVAGGYNFVSDNADPLDDNGHGTHVAGIIAAHSQSFTGIAPFAKLFAYKVLDADGNGATSSVIAAIEQAMKDSVQVINLSLGTPDGDPDDPLSQAVDAAVEAGIVVVAAAGNEGEDGSIDSPGAAREALTVGATDRSGAVASFSSRGPASRDYGYKPDIVAPGEGILSVKMNGGYTTMSGTSMAAPFVAGEAAILRRLHPEWNALQIRDAILTSATDLGVSLFCEGMGEIDTAKVRHTGSIATPSALSFGFDNPSASVWNVSDSLLITNLSATQQSYSLRVSQVVAGLQVVCTPSSFRLGSGESQSVSIAVSAQNGLLADNPTYPLGYTGAIFATTRADTLRIPYVFFKGSVFQISFSETPFQVVLHDRINKAYYYAPTGPYLNAVVPPGVYDLMTAFQGSAYVVRENLSPVSSPSVYVSRQDATHSVVITPTDENDSLLSTSGPHLAYSSIEVLRHTLSGTSILALNGGPVQTQSLVRTIQISDMSPRYSFGYALNVIQGNTRSYTYDVAIDTGLSSSLAVSFRASDLKRIDFKYDIDTTTPRIFPVIWSAFVPASGIVAVTYYDGDSPPLRYPFIQTGFYTRQAPADFPILHYREAYKY